MRVTEGWYTRMSRHSHTQAPERHVDAVKRVPSAAVPQALSRRPLPRLGARQVDRGTRAETMAETRREAARLRSAVSETHPVLLYSFFAFGLEPPLILRISMVKTRQPGTRPLSP